MRPANGIESVVTISQFVWTEERIAHIGRHGVETEEFEDVCFGDTLVLRTKAEGENPVSARWKRS